MRNGSLIEIHLYNSETFFPLHFFLLLWFEIYCGGWLSSKINSPWGDCCVGDVIWTAESWGRGICFKTLLFGRRTVLPRRPREKPWLTDRAPALHARRPQFQLSTSSSWKAQVAGDAGCLCLRPWRGTARQSRQSCPPETKGPSLVLTPPTYDPILFCPRNRKSNRNEAVS